MNRLAAIGMAYISVMFFSAWACANDTPKFDYETAQANKSMQSHLETDAYAKLQSDKFHRQSLLSNNNLIQGTNRAVSFTSKSLSLVNIGEDHSLAIKEEFTTNEIGLGNRNILQVAISENDSRLFVLTYQSNYDSNYTQETSLFQFAIEEEGLRLVSQIKDIFDGYSYYGMTMSISDGSNQLLISTNYNNQLKIIDLDFTTDAMTVSNSMSYSSDLVMGQLSDDGSILTLVYDRSSSSSLNCIETYDVNGTNMSLADGIACNGTQLTSYINRAQLDSNSNHLLLTDYRNFSLISVDANGLLSLITSGDSNTVFGTYYSNNLLLKDHMVSFIDNGYPYALKVFSYIDNGIFNEETSTDLATLVGTNYSSYLFNFKTNLMLIKLGYNNQYGVVSIDQNYSPEYGGTFDLSENSVIDAVSKLFIPVSDNLLVAVNSDELNLVQADKSKNFKILQTETLGHYNGDAYSYRKLNDTDYIILGQYGYVVLTVDVDNQKITLINSQAYGDANNNSLSIWSASNKELIADWMDNSMLVAKTSDDRLAVFELIDNNMMFKQYVVDLANDIDSIYQTSNLFTYGNNVYLVHYQTGEITQLSYADNAFVQKESNLPVQGLDYNGNIIKVGAITLFKESDNIFAFTEINGELEYLSNSPIKTGANNWVVLNNRHVIFTNNEGFELYELNPVTGFLNFLQTIKADELNLPNNANYYSQLTFDGKNIWYYSTTGYRTVGRMQINRAPSWKDNDNYKLLLNEGLAKNFQLSDYLFDLDEDVLSFSDDGLPASLNLDINNQLLAFDGSIETSDEVVVSADDGELASTFYFELQYNYAPTLMDPLQVLNVNQNEMIALDLDSIYQDFEADNYSLSIANNASLTMLANGTLTGQFKTAGKAAVNVSATDVNGATKTQEVSFLVNGAPILNNSLNTAKKGEQFNLDLASIYTDPEGDIVIYSVVNLPSGLTLSGSVISGKPQDQGNYTVVITATDSKGAKSEGELNLKIESSGGGGALAYLLGCLTLLIVVRRSRP